MLQRQLRLPVPAELPRVLRDRELLAIERRPISLLESRKKAFSRQKSLLGDLEGKLDKLFDAAKKIRNSTSFLDFTAATDNDDKYLTASAGSGATAGSYRITVDELAKAQMMESNGSPDRNQTGHGDGLLLLTVGSEPPVPIAINGIGTPYNNYRG